MSVAVPSMGDSISEGSVASLEKKPGECALLSLHALPSVIPADEHTNYLCDFLSQTESVLCLTQGAVSCAFKTRP